MEPRPVQILAFGALVLSGAIGIAAIVGWILETGEGVKVGDRVVNPR